MLTEMSSKEFIVDDNISGKILKIINFDVNMSLDQVVVRGLTVANVILRSTL